MRPVNLLPDRYRPAQATGQRHGIAYAAIGALAILLVMVLLLVVTSNQTKDANNKTAVANAEKAAADQKIGQLQAYGNFAALKQARFTAVEGVALSRFDYERLMREMALVLPHDTYLTAFQATSAGAATTGTTPTGATGSGPTVSITACAPSHKAVATAVVRLRQLHDVADVELQSSTKAAGGATATGGACVVTWTATLTFESPALSAVQQPVPARLGGGQ